jgi:hypothetical protein
VEPGASFSFKLTGKRGAALVTRYPVYREDTVDTSAFKQYTKKHYDSWVAFAKRYSGVEPVLVSGFDMTKDFAMTAYSNDDASFESDLSISVPTRDLTSTSSVPARASVSAFFQVESSGSPHTKRGPQQCTPPVTSSEPTGTGPVSEDYNQCVFLRYYTMRRWMGLFPTVIQAAAGPHDLGPGHNRDDTFTELTAHQDPAPNQEDDPMDGGEERDQIAEDAHPNVLVYNGPNV